jgi:CMP-N-acetylneuraminic acid synthetase
VKVLGIIPARGGSKAIPRKNMATLGGKPLIAWTCEAAKQSNLDRVIVSTDDEEIAKFAESFGVEVPFLRPAELSGDSSATIDAVLHALESMRDEFDAVMVLQPTSPFRTTKDINDCLTLIRQSGADSVISVVDVGGHHPARMKYLDGVRLIDPPFVELRENQPRQELRPMYIRNGAVYLTLTKVLYQGSFKGSHCVAHIMPSERSMNIDEPFDLAVAEAILSSK